MKQTIDIEQIKPNPIQPRKHFAELDSLSASIKEKGLLEPIMVRPIDGHYEIIHGERRWRAARMAGLKAMDVLVREATNQEAYELSLIENIQREDLTPIEEAKAFEQLQQQGYKQKAIASLIGKTQSYVAQKLRLLKVPEPITLYLQERALTENHIRQILKLREVYGPDLPRGISDNITLNLDTPERDIEISAGLLLVACRPDERVFYLKPTPLMIEACYQFVDYVLKHKSKVKQWVVAAFWWASVAVKLELTVADLALAIDRWSDRYEQLCVIWTFYKKDPVALGEKDDKLYWAIYGDLRHSASLHVYDDLYNQPEAVQQKYVDTLQRLIVGEGYFLPSMLQKVPGDDD